MKVYYGLTNHSQLKRMPRDLPIMVSARWLMKVRPNSIAFQYLAEYKSVFLDSGAFGCAFYDGGFTYSIEEYADLVWRVKPELWATMDYPCEPNIMPNMSVWERIESTISNTLALKKRCPYMGFVPIIQGWEVEDYLACAEKLAEAGLIKPIMGIGSICRRGKQEPIVKIVRTLYSKLLGVKFHAFGVKVNTLKYNNGEVLNYLDSIDTAAWQFNEKDELGGWRPRTYQELERRLQGYKGKLDSRLDGPYQLVL